MTVPGYRHEGVRAEKQKDRQHGRGVVGFDAATRRRGHSRASTFARLTLSDWFRLQSSLRPGHRNPALLGSLENRARISQAGITNPKTDGRSGLGARSGLSHIAPVIGFDILRRSGCGPRGLMQFRTP